MLKTLDRVFVAVAVFLIHGYRLLIAPLWIGGCRHYPTCSQYAIEALQLKGVKQGTRLAVHRIWRCRPGGTFGYDPVEHNN
jgi:putative membrane protein insertion efficiency factor